MLTDDQRRVAQLLDSLPESRPFPFAGGAAMIAHGLVQRTTTDIDYFGREPREVNELLPAVEQCLLDAGYDVERQRAALTTGFVRLDVRPTPEGMPLGLDLSHDFRIRKPVLTEIGRTLDPEELAADKTLALFGRAEARDFVDVDALVRRFGRERLLELAAEKDLGFDRGIFREMLGNLRQWSAEDFGISGEELEGFRERFEDWETSLMLDRGEESWPRRETGRDRGIE